MTEQDRKDLLELGHELLGAESSPWEPRCVARAFRSAQGAFVFTMQTWIELDAAKSPFLAGVLPEAETAVEEFEVAFRAFGTQAKTLTDCEPEEVILIGRMMIAAIQESFAMQVKLAPLEGQKMLAEGNGLGDWLPLMACLKSQLGFTLAEARECPVGQAYALIAAHRCNEGRTIAGETYAMRDVGDEEEEA